MGANFNSTPNSLPPELVFTCALASSAVYESDPAKYLNNSGKFYEYDILRARCSNEEYANQKYMVCEYMNQSKKETGLIIAFKGSDNFSDILTDLTILPMLCPFEGFFHLGFMNRAEDVPEEPFVRYLNEKENENNFRIIFTGHSLGGTIASIVGSKVLFHNGVSKESRKKVRCVTFGAPMFADSTFANFVEKNGVAFQFEHFINGRDVVPRLFSLSAATLQNYLAKGDGSTVQSIQKKMGVSFSSLIFEKTIDYIGLLNISVSNRNILILKLLWEMIKKVLNKIGNSYVPFGYTNLISSHQKYMNDGNTVIETQWEVKRYNSIGAKEVVEFNENMLELLPLAGQQHKLSNYLLNLKNFITTKAISPNVTKGTIFDFKKNDAYNDISVAYCDFNSCRQVSVEVQVKSNAEQMCLKAEISDHITNELGTFKRTSTSTTNRSVFTFNVPTVTRKLRLTVCPHFGERTCVYFPQEKWLNLDIHYTTMEARVADPKIQLVNLYLLGSSMGLKTGPRSPFKVLFKTKEHPLYINPPDTKESEKDVPSSSTISPPQDLNLMLTKKYENNGFLSSVKLPSSVTETGYEQDNIEILRCLVKLENMWWDDVKSEPIVKEDCLRDYWNNALGTLYVSGHSTRELEITSKLERFTSVIKTLHEDHKMNISQALLYCLPLLLKIQEKMVNTPVKFDWSSYRKAAVAAGIVVLFASAPFLFFGFLWIGTFAAVSAAGTSLVGTLGGIIQAHIDKQYQTWLDLFLEGFDIKTNMVHSTPFAFEKKIYEESQKCNLKGEISPHVINTSGNLLHMPTNAIVKNWEHIFNKNSRIHYLNSSCRNHAVKVLQSIWCHYLIRKHLSSSYTVGIIGESKAGKSTLSKRVFGFGKSDAKKRTTDMDMAEITENFRVIDFPHLDGSSDKYKDCVMVGRNLMDAVVVVLEGTTLIDDVKPSQLNIIKFAQSNNIPYLICMNQIDRVLFSEGSDESNSDDDESDDEQEANWDLSALSSMRKSASTKMGVTEDKLVWTCFKPRKSEYQKSLMETLKEEIRDTCYCKDWILKQAESSIPYDQMKFIKQFIPKKQSKKKKKK